VWRALLALAVLLALIPLSSRPSWAACACTGSQTPRAQADRAVLAFTGRVTSITSPLPDTASVQFRVQTLYKGTAGRSVIVTTPLSGELCHFDFVPRVRYTVFADDRSSTTACSGNVRGVISPKGYGVSPIPISKGVDAPGGAPSWVWAVIGVAVALACGGGVVAARRSSDPRSGRPSGLPRPGQ
jgi:hypothetical protein